MEITTSIVVLWLSLSFGASAPQGKKKVLILGAGLSGITAAKTLYDQGVTDFLVLEGQDYIGGRVTQASFAGIKVEMGANWIQHSDEDDDPLMPLKNKSNLTATPSNYGRHIIRNDTGADVTNSELLKQWTVASDKLFKLGEERGEEDIPPRDMPATIALEKLGWISDTPLKKLLSWNTINFEYGVSERETSLNNMAPGGEDLFITDQRGLWTLFRDFYSKFARKIVLNQTVTRIKYSDESVEVTTAEGIVYAAEYALCTFSTAVLGSKMVTFDPDLPDWKKEAIFRLRMVHYTKIFLKFPTKFWDDAEFILHVSKQRTGHFPHFQDLDRPGFFNGSKMLLATVTGDVALRIEAQDDSQTLDEVMQVLRNMYGDGIPSATEIVLSKWSQNPYVRGSWSDPVVGTDHTVHANMAGRIKNLFFGGEATHGDWYGFMQGAYYSGRERANQIASCIQRKTCEAYQPSTGLPVIAIPCPINASSYKRLSLSVMAAALIFFGSF
ncbi:PREDICTED: polyamine oxidase-like isoform X4 [Acropora digitifera]|uniref:polyamine oxidase-like isoform X4 n=1 Tax=Acropora digitifera TaxID=70779 RepID=UPI00077AFBCB|nr:PREDICTED: polyamine oxidase-like isoform X4 [Acropora digitifera]